MRKHKEFIGLLALKISILFVMVSLLIILIFISSQGVRVLGIRFLIDPPKDGMTKGGIFPAIVGTFYLSIGAIIFALPLGLLCAIYLVEYAKNKRLIKIIKVGIDALAGVPSVVFGLFGLAVFVRLFNFGVSILSGALTLGIMILPVIIKAAEEAIIAVPQEFKEASFAVGATKWQTITKIVIPTALPGIITGTVLGIGRVAGETAPILFTAATFYQRLLPRSIFDEVMALPFHIYALMTEGTEPEYQVPIAYGTAVVLLGLVIIINFIAILIRIKERKAKKW